MAQMMRRTDMTLLVEECVEEVVFEHLQHLKGHRCRHGDEGEGDHHREKLGLEHFFSRSGGLT